MRDPTEKRTLLRRLWATLTGETGPWWATLLLLAVIGKLAMTLAAVALAAIFGPGAAEDFSGKVDLTNPGIIIAVVLLAPVFESLIVVVLVWLGRLVRLPRVAVALATAALIAPLHGLAWLSLSVVPFFALHALTQYNQAARRRTWLGYGILVGAHLLSNGASVLAMPLIAG